MSLYPIHVRYSLEDTAFISEVPALPGCMADGRTHVAAIKAAEEAIEDWIEVAQKLGREIPSPFRIHAKGIQNVFHTWTA